MKSKLKYLLIAGVTGLVSCTSNTETKPDESAAITTQAPGAGQSAVQDDVSNPNIVQVAVGSKDHTTLVAAVKAAELVDVLSNAGPFTVFAPTNAAFDKLPAGTVDGLMKDDKRADLRNILEYHVAVGVYKQANMQDGQKINMVNLDDITLSVKDGRLMVNGTANVVATIPASNGIIYVIDAVLLPPAKQ